MAISRSHPTLRPTIWFSSSWRGRFRSSRKSKKECFGIHVSWRDHNIWLCLWVFHVMICNFQKEMKLCNFHVMVIKKFCLDEEMEDDLVHHIIMEVVRLEVSFCSPVFFPMRLLNDVLFSMSENLRRNVFKHKLERVADKIRVSKSDVAFGQEDDQDQDSSEMKFLRQVLEAGVSEICASCDKTLWTVVNLVSM